MLSTQSLVGALGLEENLPAAATAGDSGWIRAHIHVEQPRVKPKPSVGFTEAVYFHVVSDYKQSKPNILLLSAKNVRAGPY